LSASSKGRQALREMAMKSVLIVEDQADIRELIRMTLELEEVNIEEADNGERGLQAARASHPDLVLLDVMMPGALDGFAVCKQIKADPDTRRMKVVLLTARSQDSDRQEGDRAGADAYLTKPFSPRQLLSVVHGLLR
jgi:two-component system, OmpR family, phosphate regulon response regulator PhoB